MRILDNKKSLILVIFCALLTGFLFAWNFYPQSGVVSYIFSDTADHVVWSESIVSGNPYPLKVNTYPLFFIICGLFGKVFSNIYYGAAFAAAIIGIATYIVQLVFFDKVNIKSTYLKILLAFGLTFVWPVILNPKSLIDSGSLWAVYVKSYSPSPAHNLTSLAVRPAALLATMQYLEIIDNDSRYIKKAFLLSITIFVSVLLKPSFYQYFSVAITAFTIINFLMNRNMRTFKMSLSIACALVPATIFVLYGARYNLGEIILYPFRSLVLMYNKDAWLCFSSLSRSLIFCLVIFVVSAIKRNISKEMWFIVVNPK